jgi:O-methyltransferase
MKSLIQKLLNKIGWEIVRLEAKIPRELFDSLVHAYEHEISKSRSIIRNKPRRHNLIGKLIGTSAPEAFFIIESISRTNHLGGQVCEFGVAQGRTSALIANELLETGRVLHLFDSFAGLPAPSVEDELIDDIFNLGTMASYEGLMSVPRKQVMETLEGLEIPESSYVIHEGFIKNTLQNSTHLPEKVTFAYIDFDFYEGILDALIFVESKSIIDTEIIVDDYNFFSSGSKKAVDYFVESRTHTSWSCTVSNIVNGHFATLVRVG